MEITEALAGLRKPHSRSAILDLIGHVLRAVGIGLAANLALAAIVLLLSRSAAAADVQPIKPQEVQQGSLLLKSKDGTLAVPLLDTEVHIQVSGMVARAQVHQIFRNPDDGWREGIYVFPLPENAAVDHMKMRIGRRVVEGEILERGAARASYEQARDGGRRATLVEQERPNIFTTSVANIGPGEEIVVEIEYQQTLRYENGGGLGRYSLRFPMVVAPRYIPGATRSEGRGTGWAPDSDQVTDASRITPPVTRARDGQAPINPVRIKVDLDAGVPLASVASPYHPIHVERNGESHALIELADGTTAANRDFELAWTLAASRAPRVALFTETKEDRTYGLLMLVPPTADAAQKRLPREVVYIIDTSGSMEGTSIVQAREALEMAVARLGEEDRFNVIEFNSYARALFSEARSASADNRRKAVEFVRALRARGGTEMAAALELALDGREKPDRVRQVIFLTDGAVGNEDRLFKLIHDRLGDSRLFTVGIGSAPNSHFMARAAQAGRGTYTYIGKVEEVKEKMSALFAKLEAPMMKGVQVAWPAGSRAQAWPERVPDLYLGEPIVISTAFDKADGEVRVSALRGDTPWQASVPLAQAVEGTGMGVLWARAKIQSLTDSLRDGAKEEDVRGQVLEVALAHHLVSKYTSLVAVDKTPARPADAGLKSGAMPTNLPEGWNYDSVFGELPRGATDARWHLLLGVVALLAGALLFLRAGRDAALGFSRP